MSAVPAAIVCAWCDVDGNIHLVEPETGLIQSGWLPVGLGECQPLRQAIQAEAEIGPHGEYRVPGSGIGQRLKRLKACIAFADLLSTRMAKPVRKSLS